MIYWICPSIEESEENNLISIEERYKVLKEKLPNTEISIAHGKQDINERNLSSKREVRRQRHQGVSICNQDEEFYRSDEGNASKGSKQDASRKNPFRLAKYMKLNEPLLV